MAQSLKSAQTPQAKVNEFQLRWQSPPYNGKTLILVEGRDDRVFYFKFFKHTTSSIEICGGCGTMKEIHGLLQQQNTISHFAIKDSDFARLESIPPYSSNMFYADAHDYEMMCLREKGIREELFANLAFPYEERLIADVINCLTYLSFFKWYNYAHHCNYVFKGNKVPVDGTISLNSFSDIHACSCRGGHSTPIDESDLNAFVTTHSGCDPYEFINGHDFIKCLCSHLKRKDASLFNNLNEEKLKNTLHPCFRLENFMGTALYQSILDWQVMMQKDVLSLI